MVLFTYKNGIVHVQKWYCSRTKMVFIYSITIDIKAFFSSLMY